MKIYHKFTPTADKPQLEIYFLPSFFHYPPSFLSILTPSPCLFLGLLTYISWKNMLFLMKLLLGCCSLASNAICNLEHCQMTKTGFSDYSAWARRSEKQLNAGHDLFKLCHFIHSTFHPSESFTCFILFSLYATHFYTCILQRQQNLSLTGHPVSPDQMNPKQLLGPGILGRGKRPTFESTNGGHLEIRSDMS